MRKSVFISAIMLLSASFIHAKEYTAGVYVTGLYNFDYVEQTFCTDFWLWALYDGDETDFNGTLDPINDLEFTPVIYSSERLENGKFWMQQKIQALYQYKWDMRKFPFDSVTLRIELEDFRDAGEIKFLPDRKNSGVSNMIEVDGWNIQGFELYEEEIKYDTTFGNEYRNSDSNVYSRLYAGIKMERKNPWVTFFKLTACIYISIIISFLPFFMKPNTDSRLSLPCAGLFAIVSNKYVVEAGVPSSTALTMLDTIHSLAMVCILLIFAVLIRTDGMRSTGQERLVARSFAIDYISAVVIAAVFTLVNVLLFLSK